MSSSNAGPAQSNKPTDLNHLLLIVHKPGTENETWDHALNEFISLDGRQSQIRAAGDFDYQAFRNTLFGDISISRNDTLYTRSQFVNIENEDTFANCLTQVQNRDNTVPIHNLYKLPHLELWPTDVPGRLRPRRGAPPRQPQGSTSNQPQGSTPNPENSDRVRNPPSIDRPVDDQVEPERDPEDPDPDKSGSTDKDYDDGHTLLDTLVPLGDANDDEWKQVCKFFSCKETDRRIEVLGISLALLPYQAYAVWRVFKQVATDNIRSYMIGDAPGLGKTGTSLTIAVIFAMLKTTYEEVRKERRTNNPKNHLPEIGDEKVCPTQGRRILCPCVQGGLSYDIVRALDDFPTIICSPPGLIRQWVQEAEKWIDHSPYSPSRKINVFPHHHELGLLSLEIRKNIAGILPPMGEETSIINPKLNSSSTIVVLSSKGIVPFENLFGVVRPIASTKRRKQTKTLNSLGSSLMFFDEYHNYKGSKNVLTEPFQVLHRMKQRLRLPPMAIGLSASLRQGPIFFRPFVVYAFHSATTPQAEIGGLKPGELEKYCTDFDYLVNNPERSNMTERQRRDHAPRQERVATFLRNFLPQMVLARKRGTIFRGRRIAAQDAPVNEIRLDMPQGQTRTTFEAMSARVKRYINTRYNEEYKNWVDGGSEGNPPDKARFYHQTVDGMSNDYRNRNSREWEILTKASCFPYVAYLVNSGLVDNDDLLVNRINARATPISRLLDPTRLFDPSQTPESRRDTIRVIDEILDQSPFPAHLVTLRNQSPKIRWVEGRIDELLRIARQPRDSVNVIQGFGPPPPDGTNIRHALVLSQAPVSAFISFMVLWDSFRNAILQGRLVIQYAHSGVKQKPRADIAAYMQQDCEGRRPVKVLVSTTEIFGEGFNLQRVNTAIITEVGGSYEKQRQAFGRVDRTGQTMRPLLYQLYDQENLCERVRRLRNQTRRTIAESGQDERDDGDPGIIDLIDR
ncbi:hypothetical protein EKO27_g1972 [Xylaria grammica]|uniref:Helicase C-terminal domain-containing protein n=1 Tax=Xylaria grammica TaxID=363999 RepID=A0A439DFH5_9PEZI|nr:hypothetical protein EKO27_g1972 [Xylaria grammica]